MIKSSDSLKVSHKEWRKLAKKMRRKRLRQNAAAERDKGIEPVEELSDDELELFEREEEERERKILHLKWIRENEEAQKKWEQLQEVNRLAETKRQEAQDKIKAEWEAARKKKLDIAKKEKERLEEINAKIIFFMENGGSIPEELRILTETNPGKEACPFFSKVAACRFGPSCSRNHAVPGISRIIIIPNFYSHYTLSNNRSTEYDTDINLEFDETDTYVDFCDFFDDVVQELRRYGELNVVQICRNSLPHLRGNLLAEYSLERFALAAARGLNARWYGGKQLSVNFGLIPDWGAAICGHDKRGRCPKGSECNFLHVFRNPRGQLVPRGTKRNEAPHRESSTRTWRWSESPERNVRSRSRSHRSSSSRRSRKSRSRSRERKSGKHRKEKRRRSRNRQSKCDRRKSPSDFESVTRDVERSSTMDRSRS